MRAKLLYDTKPGSFMIDIFLKALPFFALIALGYGATRCKFLGADEIKGLTRFVFYFALSALIFRFAANLPLSEIFETQLAAGYLFGGVAVYTVTWGVAKLRKQSGDVAAIEAQCAAVGNMGYMGLPLLALLLGEAAIGPTILMLAIDLVVFASLLVILVTANKEQVALGPALANVAKGLAKNPMIVSILAGLAVSATGTGLPPVPDQFFEILAGAASPCTLFLIGASLADKSAERIEVALWLSFAKLILHPIFVAIGVLWLFSPSPYAAAVAISGASLPVAGNVYILAAHYGVAPQRVSASILFSTIFSVFTISAIVSIVMPG